ncbi:MAG: FtsW/RodA/SpoVE family cell cycle protein [bacterium]|nr:FtsW/RodA/SpoVE family cell cycle protein [bacterium]
MILVRQVVDHLNFNFDRWMLASVICLLLIGLLMNMMATSNKLTDSTAITGSLSATVIDVYAKFKTHSLKVAIGLVFAVACYLTPLMVWQSRKTTYTLIAVSMVLFILTYFFGEDINGARRWLRIGGFQLSPSDVARFSLILWLSQFLFEKREELHLISNSVKAAAMIAMICLPIVLQPNLSTVMIIFAIAGSMLWVSGIPRKWFFYLGALVIAFGVFHVAGSSFRSNRSQVFIDPFAIYYNFDSQYQIDPVGATMLKETSYQQRQSIMALVQGGLTGVVYGTGKQKYFLPEAYNDCIVAIVGEEWGMIGILLVLAGFGVLTWRGFRTTVNSIDAYKYFLAFGIVMNFLAYFFIHFFVNVSAMPSTGVPLPFISHGGTAMVFNLGLAAILLRLSAEPKCPLFVK